MSETTNNPQEKTVGGPPPKLDLTREMAKPAAVPVTAPAPTPAAPVAAAVPAPVAPAAPVSQPAAAANKPSSPVIRVGAAPAGLEAKKPMPTVATPAGGRPIVPARRPTLSTPRPVTPTPPPTPVVAAKIVAPAPAAPAAPAADPMAKKETAKIPLDMAVPAVPVETAAPKAPVVGGKPSATTPIDEKRMTSRISLEAVMSDTGAPAKRQLSTPSPGVDAGKTIRLKRPSEAATVRVTARPRIAKLEESGTSEAKAALNRTARLEESTEEGGEEEGATPTKRKTIRIKRPGQAEAAMDMAVAREEGVPLMVRDDVPHALFPVFAILTLIVVMVSIYVFSAQAFGRNICWTDYSYGVPDMDLPWVNKIPPPAVH